MKVVLFCGGLGMRIREHSSSMPKPMVEIGYRPLIWHVMKYYATFGHNEFILCLGYKANEIKKYFLDYNECISNDFVLSNGGRDVKLLNTDTQDWSITFVDTGLNSNIGQRLKIVEPYLKGEKAFLANYADGLSDLPLPRMIEFAERHDKVACFLSVRPNHSFHVVRLTNGVYVRDIQHLKKSGIWINGGFFVFKRSIFEYLQEGEELVEEPFRRLIQERQLITYKYDGFWVGMDTFKDKQLLDEMYSRGEAPWEVWKQSLTL